MSRHKGAIKQVVSNVTDCIRTDTQIMRHRDVPYNDSFTAHELLF